MKSRFLGQSAFRLYKFILAVYFLFWCVYWPAGEGVTDAGQFVTYWTFYVGAICEFGPSNTEWSSHVARGTCHDYRDLRRTKLRVCLSIPCSPRAKAFT